MRLKSRSCVKVAMPHSRGGNVLTNVRPSRLCSITQYIGIRLT